MGKIKIWKRKIRDRHFVRNQIREHDTFETPENRFRDFLTETDKKAIDKARELNEIVDKSLNDVKEINWKVKLEAQFEHDYPSRKAIWHGNPTGLFKAWLTEKGQYDAYFEEDKKDNEIQPSGSLTLS